jgi:hypothetical protein
MNRLFFLATFLLLYPNTIQPHFYQDRQDTKHLIHHGLMLQSMDNWPFGAD